MDNKPKRQLTEDQLAKLAKAREKQTKLVSVIMKFRNLNATILSMKKRSKNK